MKNAITPIFVFLSIAILLWLAAFAVSSQLAGAPKAEVPSPQRAQLAHEIESDPKAVEPRLRLAALLLSEAQEKRNVALIMQAAKVYHDVLTIDDKNPAALLGLAELCYNFGIFDKALEYYPKYLEVRPDDLQAKTDYAVVLFKTNAQEKAVTALQEVVKSNARFYPAYIALALAHRELGHEEDALHAEQQALAAAPDAEARSRTEALFREAREAGAAEKPTRITQSPAMEIENYFRAHPIIGPKVQRIVWSSENKVQIVVADFPVQSMPEEMRATFVTNTQSALASLPSKVTIELIDQASNAPLFTIDVGAAQAPALASPTPGASSEHP